MSGHGQALRPSGGSGREDSHDDDDEAPSPRAPAEAVRPDAEGDAPAGVLVGGGASRPVAGGGGGTRAALAPDRNHHAAAGGVTDVRFRTSW